MPVTGEDRADISGLPELLILDDIPVAFILIVHMGFLSLSGDILFFRFYALFMGRMQGLNVCLKLLSRKPPQLVICFRSWGLCVPAFIRDRQIAQHCDIQGQRSFRVVCNDRGGLRLGRLGWLSAHRHERLFHVSVAQAG